MAWWTCNWWDDIRRRPKILVVPVLATVVLAVASCLGVYFGAQLSSQTAKTDAHALCVSITEGFAIKFQLALAPLFAVEALLRINPNWTEMEPYLKVFIMDLLPKYEISFIQIDPFMIGGIELPPGLADINHDINWLVKLPERMTVPIASWPNDTVLGPHNFNYPGWGVNVKHLIFVDRHWNLSTMGLPYNGTSDPGPTWWNCKLCHSINPTMQLWGGSSSNIDLTPLLTGDDVYFSQLNHRYHYKLWQPGHFSRYFNDNLTRVEIAGFGKAVLNDPITIGFVVIEGNMWYIDLEPLHGWSPAWELPLLICLPFISLLVGVLVLARYIATERHLRLLQALVPDETAHYSSLYGDLDMSGDRSVDPRHLTNSLTTLRANQLTSEGAMKPGNRHSGGVHKASAYLGTGTPAEKILTLLGQLMEGRIPPIEDIIAIRQAFKESADLFTAPTSLGTNMAKKLPNDVTMALLTIVAQAAPTTTAGKHSDASGSPLAAVGSSLQGPFDKQPLFASRFSCDSVEASRGRSSKRTSFSFNQVHPEEGGHNSGEALLSKNNSCAKEELESGPPVPLVTAPSLNTHLERSIAGNHVATRAFTESIRTMLQQACNDWFFDNAPLREATNDHAMSTLTLYILTVDTSLALKLRLDLGRLSNFLDAIELLYNANPYHNRAHAADVVQMYHTIIKRCMLRRGYVDGPLTQLACILAAAVHDVDHKGVNNDFLVNSKNPLAVMHNDKSPMEAHHCHVAFTVLFKDECNFITALTTAEQKAFRTLVIDLVLATDMKQHFAIVAQFTSKNRLAGGAVKLSPQGLSEVNSRETSIQVGSSLRDALPRKLTSKLTGDLSVVDEGASAHQAPPDDGEKLIALQAALKIADIGHICRPIVVASRCLTSLEEEFFRQGDEERSLGLPISPLFDRTKEGVTKAQKGFLEFIAIPLVHNFVHVFPECKPLLNELKANYHCWAAPTPQLQGVTVKK